MVTNKHYKEFLDNGFIDIVNLDGLTNILDNITGIRGKHIKEARSMVICMYYTGMRPEEMFNLYQGMIYQEKSYCIIDAPAAKNGLRRKIHLQMRRPFVKEMYKYCWNQFPKILLFRNYKGKYVRHYLDKSGKVRLYTETSYKFRYHFYKWSSAFFKGGIPPYYLRHSKFSKLIQTGKLTPNDIKQLKGGKSLRCVEPYLHMDTKRSKSIAKYNH